MLSLLLAHLTPRLLLARLTPRLLACLTLRLLTCVRLPAHLTLKLLHGLSHTQATAGPFHTSYC